MTQPDPRVLVHTPAELSQSYVQWAESIKRDPGITWDIPSLDKKIIPMRPGNLVCLIARPGHGKSSVMAYHAKREAERIIERRTQETECVVYVTWESSAEELTNFFISDQNLSATDVAWGRANLNEVKERAIKQANVPIYVIGHGVSRAGQQMPRMTPDIVFSAIESMKEDFGVKPTLMCFDYIQLIPIPGRSKRVEQVAEAPIRIKEVAARVGAPALCGVQASRDVDSYALKLAEMKDAQWGSSIEQAGDKVFSLWRPTLTEERGTFVEIGDNAFEVTPTLMVIRMIKQRFEDGRHTWGLHFDPSYIRLADLELRYEGRKLNGN